MDTLNGVRKVVKNRCKSVDVTTTTGNLYALSRQQQHHANINSSGIVGSSRHRLMQSISTIVDPTDSSSGSYCDEASITANDVEFREPKGDEKSTFNPDEWDRTGSGDLREKRRARIGELENLGKERQHRGQQFELEATRKKVTMTGEDRTKCHKEDKFNVQNATAEVLAQPAAERGDSKTNEDSRDELEDGDCCLSSELAKRVVLVDEADKMLLLRAQSATPPKQEGQQHQQYHEVDTDNSKETTTPPSAGPSSGSRVTEAGLTSDFAPIIVNRLDRSSRFSIESSGRAMGDTIGCSPDRAARNLRERRLNSLATISYVDSCNSGKSAPTPKERRQSSYSSSELAADAKMCIATRSRGACASTCTRQLQKYAQNDIPSSREQSNEQLQTWHHKKPPTALSISENNQLRSNKNNKDQGEEEPGYEEVVELDEQEEELEQPSCGFAIQRESTSSIKRASLVRSPLGHLVQQISSCQLVSGQDSLDLELRGEREFNESLRKGSPVDTRLLGDKLHQLSNPQAIATTTTKQHRQRQSLDCTSIPSPCQKQVGGSVGLRRLTLDSGRACCLGQNHSFPNWHCDHSKTSKESESKAGGKPSCIEAISVIGIGKLAGSSKSGRRVSFGNIDDQSAPELENRKTRLASIAFGERAPQLIERARNRAQSTTATPTTSIFNSTLIAASHHQFHQHQHKSPATTTTKTTPTTNQQLENLLKLTRENSVASSQERIISPKSILTSSNQPISQTRLIPPETSQTACKNTDLKRYSVSSVLDPALQILHKNSLRDQQEKLEEESVDSIGRTNRSKSIAANRTESRPQPFMKATLSYKMDPVGSKSEQKQQQSTETSSPINESGIMKAEESPSYQGGAHGGRSQVTSVLSSPSRSSSITIKDSNTSSSTSREINSDDDYQAVCNTENNNNNQTSSAPTQGSDNTKKGSKVESIMANARLRQEEFARLLEEHEQIVNEINRVETKMSTSQSSLQQQDTATTITTTIINSGNMPTQTDDKKIIKPF